MLGERDAVVAEVRPYDVHGSPHVQVALAFADRTFAAGRSLAPRACRRICARRSRGGSSGDERRGRRSSARGRASATALVGRALFADGLDALERLAEVRRATPPASRTTRRTHHARAWLRDRATPASTSVSRTVRSGHPQARHRRRRKRREEDPLVSAGRAPADLAAESPLGLVGDPHALRPACPRGSPGCAPRERPSSSRVRRPRATRARRACPTTRISSRSNCHARARR